MAVFLEECRDGRSAKARVGLPSLASSQCNVWPCETWYSTTGFPAGGCG